jgi:hypothetical protein
MRLRRRSGAVREAPSERRERGSEDLAAREGAARERADRGAGVSQAPEGEAPRARRRGLAWRTRDAGAAAVGAAGAGVILVARLVMAVATLIALLIALAIVLRDVNANAGNSIVKGIHDAANFFAGAFTDLIKFKGRPKRAITVNWGIALIVYLIVGAVIARLIARVGRRGLRFERRRRAAPML